jgi:hypothetical protein
MKWCNTSLSGAALVGFVESENFICAAVDGVLDVAIPLSTPSGIRGNTTYVLRLLDLHS